MYWAIIERFGLEFTEVMEAVWGGKFAYIGLTICIGELLWWKQFFVGTGDIDNNELLVVLKSFEDSSTSTAY